MAQTYESIAFLSKEEAHDTMRILREKGEAAALEHLKQWHEPGEGTLVSTRGNPWKTHDHVYEDGDWVMFYNFDVPYIGLVCRLEGLDSPRLE